MNVAPLLAYTWSMETPLTPAQVNVRVAELVDTRLIDMLNEMIVEAYARHYFDLAQLSMGKVMDRAEDLLPDLDESDLKIMLSRAGQAFTAAGWYVRVKGDNYEFNGTPFDDEDEDYE